MAQDESAQMGGLFGRSSKDDSQFLKGRANRTETSRRELQIGPVAAVH